MDGWDELCYPDDEEDFEGRFADELEVMNETTGGSTGADPPSRKSLNFNDQSKKPSETIMIDNCKNSENNITSKKRPNDDMYGSILDDEDDETIIKTLTDLDMDTLGPSKKRSRRTSPRTKDHHDINGNTSPIANSNKHYKKTVSPFQKSTDHISRNECSLDNGIPTSGRMDDCRAFKSPPMGKECITVTKTDGERLYLCIDDDPNDCCIKSKPSTKSSQKRHNSLQLLQVPFNVIRQHVDEERRRKITEESDRLAASLRRALQNEAHIDDMHSSELYDTAKVIEHTLWVEKYSPKLFTELLSDDAINRTLLKWLKLWDKVVFNKTKGVGKPKSTKQTKEDDKEKPNQHKGNKKFKKGGIESEEWIEVDSNGCPLHKVALLCGPPGLGKTTLAHVIARHAGYNVVEMNASDDRTADVFKQKIETATQMKSVLGANERPNCLVIDEIDGAPTAAINVLLSFIKKKDSVSSDEGKKTKRKKAQTLSRPIICICNDQFVPSLRQLRQQALVALFPKTIPGRLAGRLNEISRREEIQTDMTTLLALCDKADNDIRSCLNTLQFVHKRNRSLSMDYVQSNDVGQKDLHKNLFTIMQEIFQLPKPKRKRFADLNDNTNERKEFLKSLGIGGDLGLPGKSVSPLTSRFHNTLRSASACGQYDKLAQGLFENYLNIKFKDSGLNALVSGTEWLEFADFIEQQVNSSQQYTLRRYSPFLSVAFHLLFATPSSSKLSYPSSQYECYLKQVKMSSMITSMKSEASPRIRSVMDGRIACLDLFPLLLEIITPNMRPVNMQLFSAREKQQMSELISSMIAYNLTYHQERSYEGQYTYVLDPNIEELVKFPSLPQHKQLPYATKQLIAREIDLEKMRRAEAFVHSRHGRAQDTPVASFPPKVPKAATPKSTKPDQLLNKVKQNKQKVALDFFGQPIKQKNDKGSLEGQNANNPDHSNKLIWFKFNEGYSNAVRKNVKVQDLL